jgi:hypothetical protein
MNKPLLVHLINGEIEIRWVGRLKVYGEAVFKNIKGELCYKICPECKVQENEYGYFIYTWVDEECWDNDSDHLSWFYVDYWTFLPTLKDNL